MAKKNKISSVKFKIHWRGEGKPEHDDSSFLGLQLPIIYQVPSVCARDNLLR